MGSDLTFLHSHGKWLSLASCKVKMNPLQVAFVILPKSARKDFFTGESTSSKARYYGTATICSIYEDEDDDEDDFRACYARIGVL